MNARIFLTDWFTSLGGDRSDLHMLDELRDKTSDAADALYLAALETARFQATRDFNEFEMSDCLCDKALLIAVLGEATDEEVGALVKKLVGERIENNAQFMAEVS